MPAIKLMDMMHYIIHKTSDDPSVLGATKLNKVLWFVDTFHFIENRRGLTDAEYVKMQFGPTPERSMLTSAFAALQKAGKIEIEEDNFHGYIQRRYRSLKTPEIKLSKKARALVDDVIEIVCEHTATDISEITHDSIWQKLEIGEKLPLYSCLVAKLGDETPEIRKWAESVE